jgi:hypothetical protein
MSEYRHPLGMLAFLVSTAPDKHSVDPPSLPKRIAHPLCRLCGSEFIRERAGTSNIASA